MTTRYDFLPHQLLSSMAGYFSRSQKPFIKNHFIQWFCEHYGVDLSDSIIQNPTEFASFQDFFSRALRPGARPIAPGANTIVSPADGILSSQGEIREHALVQAKGQYYSLPQLLADENWAAKFAEGAYYTVYLSPKDYHRVHMPLAGSLLSMRYIPGRLFPVNNQSARRVDRLFVRNERLICYFRTDFGPIAVILVGALLVGQMSTVWQKTINSNRPNKIQDWHYDGKQEFEKGDEIGRFTMGSTVIVLLPSVKMIGCESIQSKGASVKMGQALADFFQ
jgi:phosphatidylserine decarboxylase